MCIRQFQNRIEESVYALLIVQIKRFGLQKEFHVTNNKITHRRTGSTFIFYGMHRHFEEIKSTEGVDICWIEEGQFLTPEQWRDLNPTIRKEGSQVWIIFNPRYVSDFVWKYFVVNPPANTIIRRINYDENMFLSQTMLDLINEMRKNDPDEYEHVYLGVPLTDDEAVIIKRTHIMAAIDAHEILNIKPSGRWRIGYDIADDGPDLNSTTTAYGFLAMSCQEWKGGVDELLKSCTRVWNQARDFNAEIHYDCIGVGASAGAKFKELNEANKIYIPYYPFNAGGKVWEPDREYKPKVLNKDHFENLKAQTWRYVGDQFRNTYNAVKNGQVYKQSEMIAINSKIQLLEKLIDELSTPRRDYAKTTGKEKVESKEDLAKRGIPSHNLADGFIQAYNPMIGSHINYGDLL